MALAVNQLVYRLFLDRLISNPPGWRFRLFTNLVVPSRTNVLADFTEATFPGYAQITNLVFDAATDEAGPKARVTRAALIWTRNVTGAPQTIRGYYVVGTANILAWAEAFDTPVTVTVNGDIVQLTPSLDFTSQYPPPTPV